MCLSVKEINNFALSFLISLPGVEMFVLLLSWICISYICSSCRTVAWILFTPQMTCAPASAKHSYGIQCLPGSTQTKCRAHTCNELLLSHSSFKNTQQPVKSTHTNTYMFHYDFLSTCGCVGSFQGVFKIWRCEPPIRQNEDNRAPVTSNEC